MHTEQHEARRGTLASQLRIARHRWAGRQGESASTSTTSKREVAKRERRGDAHPTRATASAPVMCSTWTASVDTSPAAARRTACRRFHSSSSLGLIAFMAMSCCRRAATAPAGASFACQLQQTEARMCRLAPAPTDAVTSARASRLPLPPSQPDPPFFKAGSHASSTHVAKNIPVERTARHPGRGRGTCPHDDFRLACACNKGGGNRKACGMHQKKTCCCSTGYSFDIDAPPELVHQRTPSQRLSPRGFSSGSRALRYLGLQRLD